MIKNYASVPKNNGNNSKNRIKSKKENSMDEMASIDLSNIVKKESE